jgi:hypothetical protein
MTRSRKRIIALVCVVFLTAYLVPLIKVIPALVPSELPHWYASTYLREQANDSLRIMKLKDTMYRRRSWDVRRRARLVPTDSLARLNVALFVAQDTMRGYVRRAIGCELYRLLATYGGPAADRAINRFTDSVKRAGTMDWGKRNNLMALAKGPDLEIGEEACGNAMFQLPQLPDSIEEEPTSRGWPHYRPSADSANAVRIRDSARSGPGDPRPAKIKR